MKDDYATDSRVNPGFWARAYPPVPGLGLGLGLSPETWLDPDSHYLTYTVLALEGWENVHFELGSERIEAVEFVDSSSPFVLISVMAFVTYVLVAGLVLGTQNRYEHCALGCVSQLLDKFRKHTLT